MKGKLQQCSMETKDQIKSLFDLDSNESVKTKENSDHLFRLSEEYGELFPKVDMELSSEELLELSNNLLDELKNTPLPINLSIPTEFTLFEQVESSNSKSLNSIIPAIYDLLEKKTDSNGKSIIQSLVNKIKSKGAKKPKMLSISDLKKRTYSNVNDVVRDFDQMLNAFQKAKPGDTSVYKSALRIREEFFQEMEIYFPEDIQLLKKLKTKNQIQSELNEEAHRTRNSRKRKTEDTFFYYGSKVEDEAEEEELELKVKTEESKRKILKGTKKELENNRLVVSEGKGKRGR